MMDSDPLNLSRCRDKFDRQRLLQVLKQLVAMRNNLNSEDPVLVLLDRLSLVVIDCMCSRALEKTNGSGIAHSRNNKQLCG